MKFNFEKKTKLFYILAFFAMLSIMLTLFKNSRNIKDSEFLVEHTLNVLHVNDNILFDVLNIETSSRGYFLTGKAEFLEPYNTALNKINTDLNLLKKFTTDNKIQQNRFYSLQRIISKRFILTKSLVEAKKQNRLSNTDKIDQGRILTDSIRKLIYSINKTESKLLKIRKNENKKNNENSLTLFIFLMVMILLIFILIAIIINNQKTRTKELAVFNDSQKIQSQYSLSLIEASLDPLVTINTFGKITDLNEATVRITGINREKLVGSNFFEYFTEKHKAEEVYQEVFHKGFVVDSPLTLRHKNGKLTDVLFNGSVYKDDYGNVLGVVIVARDIAEQKWALDLRDANKELAFQNDEKQKRADELSIANKELAFQNEEKEKRAAELSIANKELAFQNEEKEKRADELIIANAELAFQNDEKEKRADELYIANEELAFQNQEKEKRAEELFIANKELAFQNKVKEKRAAQLVIANKELAFQNEEKEKRAAELVIANKELLYQTSEKQDRADELLIADKELAFQNEEKLKQNILTKEIQELSSSAKLASQYSLSLIEASRDPLFTISPEGKITDMNQASVRVTGKTRAYLIGSDFSDYFTEPDKAKEGYEEVFSKGFVVDYPLTITDGVLTDVLFNGSVYKDEDQNVIGAVVVARDITEQKRIENELIEAKVFAELATGIAQEATIDAELATHLAENAVKSKQQFLSNMSHEIRTPMNAIIGFTKVVLKTELSAKQREYLTAIKMSGDALIVLINDILDLAKVDAGKMQFDKTPFKLKQSIDAMLHLFETKIQEKNLKLTTEFDTNIPEVLLGDSVRLHQIILNLVSNAVKFTNIGKINVGVRLLSEDEEKVTIEFSISDTGIGIKAEKIDSVFENFQQATSGTSRLFGGTGLGLAIVKQLIEPQGGSIRVESEYAVGSTFSFILPFLKTSEEVVLEAEVVEFNREIKGVKVLVVEDMELNQLLMRTLLEDFGFECDIAANGKLAIEKLKDNHFDIILMDLQMPEMNGFEATEYIRKTLKSKIPIVALTADVTTVDVTKCLEVGMNDYIAKPVDERLLFNKLVGLVKKPIIEKIYRTDKNKILKYIDLSYLMQRTKSNPNMMAEMISIYLDQTPKLILAMKQSFEDKDWTMLHASVHKMIPSFAIMGMNSEFEEIAKKIQNYAKTQELTGGVNELVLQLEDVCNQACEELEIELKNLKITSNEK